MQAETQTTEAASGGDSTDVGEPVIEVGRYDNQDFHGLVDDIFVFDEALDAHQVKCSSLAANNDAGVLTTKTE